MGPGPGAAGPGTPFPDPPKGDPGPITGAARSLGNAADDLESAEGGLHGANAELQADWQGYAANAYHGASSTLAHVARGASETFRECAHAVSGYAAALDQCQSEIKRLRHGWEKARQRQAANDALALKLVNSITPSTKPDDATRVNTQVTTASGQANDAGTEADHYALRANHALTDQAGVLKDGTKEIVTSLVRNRWAYTSYTTGRLDAVRTALLKSDNPAARAAARIIGTILRYRQ